MMRSDISGIKLNKYFFAWLCFVIAAVFYISTCSRTVPPYRDSGELITSATTLSIAHSPGYPVYMVLGKLATVIGGVFDINPAWSVNLLSSIAGAFTAFFIVLLLFEITGNMAASVLGSLIAVFAHMNWYLAVVAEMYSLNLMFVAILLYLLYTGRYGSFSFIAGLMLGNHLTSLFAFLPMAVYVLIPGNKKPAVIKNCLYFALGLSVYIYLPVRAAAGPFTNWGDPSTLAGLWKVVTRSAYGHTLDLVSKEVTLKQVFMPHILLFVKSVIRDISPFALVLSSGGIYLSLKTGKRDQKLFSVILIAIFLLTGPFFLFMAKMPVNPHAVAIVEVGYMIPELVLALFAGIGFAAVLGFIKKKNVRTGVVFLSMLIPAANVYRIYPQVDMSSNYIARDYAHDILNSVEKRAAVIMRRDHTLFALWYLKDIEGFRKDVMVLSKGLLSAAWYRQKLQIDHNEVKWKKDFINDEEYMEWFYGVYSGIAPVYMTPAAAGGLSEDFYKKYRLVPYGLLLKMVPADTDYDPDAALEKIDAAYRFDAGLYNLDTADFFTKDFIGLYAKFYDRLGMEYFKLSKHAESEKMFLKSSRIDPGYYKPYSNLAYLFFSKGQLDKAVAEYLNAAELLEKMISHYTRNKHLKKELAEIYNNIGAIYEKRMRQTGESRWFDHALENYKKSIIFDEKYSQAYFNMGVLYWGKKDWPRVIAYLETALKYEPLNENTKKYLIAARRNLRQNQ
ncbi:MAG: DUF2723 domain-containing protein [Elusimicrobiota bacterium]